MKNIYINIWFIVLQPRDLVFGYWLFLNLKVWNVLVPKYFFAFEEADINQLLFSDIDALCNFNALCRGYIPIIAIIKDYLFSFPLP